MTSRNDPCPCGSGTKFKKCCGAAAKATPSSTQAPARDARAKASEASAAPDAPAAPAAPAASEAAAASGASEGMFSKPAPNAAKAEAARSKHLRNKGKSGGGDPPGTLVYSTRSTIHRRQGR